MKKILCISNVGTNEVGGRSGALKTRFEALKSNGWTVETILIKKEHEIIWKLFRIINKIKNENFKIIWSINNPFFLHMPPLILKKLKYKFIWIVEFRDPLYLNPNPAIRSKLLYKILENEIIKESEIVVIFRGIQADKLDFLKMYGQNIQNKLFVLPYVGIETTESCVETSYLKNIPFTITYAGSFYKNWIEPFTFLKGFKIFVDNLELTPDDVQVYFLGDWDKRYAKEVTNMDLQDYINVKGWIKRSELKLFFEKSHLFLYIGGSKRDNRKNVSIKVWDYLCYGKPILALVGKDFEMCNFIIKYNFGYIADYDNPVDIYKKLCQAYWDYAENNVYKKLKKYLKNRELFKRYNHDDTFVKICELAYEKLL